MVRREHGNLFSTATKWNILELPSNFFNVLFSENEGTKNENGIRSGTAIRRTEIGIRMGTDGTKTANDLGI